MSVYARFASAILESKLFGYPNVSDILVVLAEDMDRQEQGIGRQNFKYGPSLTQSANMCVMVSPQLYRILVKRMPLPTLRHIQYVLMVVVHVPLKHSAPVVQRMQLPNSHYLFARRPSLLLPVTCSL